MNTLFHHESFTRAAEQEIDSRAAGELSSLLTSAELAEQIQAGNISVAMIRPSLQGSTLEGWPDSEAADHIEESIGDLGVAAKFSVRFDRESVEEFYSGQPKEVQLKLPAERYSPFQNRWEEFVDLMMSGPTTVLLLHSNEGDAIAKWRNQVGHYDIVNRRDPANLRGKFGLDNYNNLIHGSDSVESVAREVALLDALLAKNSPDTERIVPEKNDYAASFLGSKTLEILGVQDSSAITIHKDWTPTGEVYSTDFTVDKNGENEHLIAKACIKPLPTATVQEWLDRRQIISELGITVPALKNVSDATIIEEFIPYTFKEAYTTSDNSTKLEMETLFLDTCKALLMEGFTPLSLHDVRSHGNDLVIVDFGEDLGGKLGNGELNQDEIEAIAQNHLRKIIGN